MCLELPWPTSFLRHPLAYFILWASSAYFIFWASSAHFILPYLLHSHGFLAKSFRLPSPITTSLPFKLLGLCANPMNLLIPFLGFFDPFLLSLHLLQFSWAYYFIPWASSTHLLSFWILIILWVCWPLFLPFWSNGLYFTIFFLHLFHIFGLLLPSGHLVKSGHQ